MKKRVPSKTANPAAVSETGETAYQDIHSSIVALLEAARSTAARNVNALMTASYWEIGRRIVEFEQGGKGRAEYGEALLARLSIDLTARFGRGFGQRNLQDMRLFYLAWSADRVLQTLSAKFPDEKIWQTPSAKSLLAPISETLSRKSSNLAVTAQAFPLPWSAYVRPRARRWFFVGATGGSPFGVSFLQGARASCKRRLKHRLSWFRPRAGDPPVAPTVSALPCNIPRGGGGILPPSSSLTGR